MKDLGMKGIARGLKPAFRAKGADQLVPRVFHVTCAHPAHRLPISGTGHRSNQREVQDELSPRFLAQDFEIASELLGK
jgi:hypothetical protein